MTENTNENISPKNGKYHATLLTNLFLGNWGIHRIINKKFVTGFIMLAVTLINAILLLLGIIFDSTVLYIIAIVITSIVSIIAFIDFIFIIAQKFKHKNKQYIKSGSKFFKTWSNIVAIVVIVLSFFIGSVSGVVMVVTKVTVDKAVRNDLYSCVVDEGDEYDIDLKQLDQFMKSEGFDKINDALENDIHYHRNLDNTTVLDLYYYIYPDDSVSCSFTLSVDGRNQEEEYIAYASSASSDDSIQVTLYYSVDDRSVALYDINEGEIAEDYLDNIIDEDVMIEVAEIYLIERTNLFNK